MNRERPLPHLCDHYLYSQSSYHNRQDDSEVLSISLLQEDGDYQFFYLCKMIRGTRTPFLRGCSRFE